LRLALRWRFEVQRFADSGGNLAKDLVPPRQSLPGFVTLPHAVGGRQCFGQSAGRVGDGADTRNIPIFSNMPDETPPQAGHPALRLNVHSPDIQTRRAKK